MRNTFNYLKKSQLLKNTSFYVFAEIINKVVPFLLLPILTVYLTPSDYGIVATYGAFTAILGIVINLGVDSSVAVNYFKLSKEQLKIYIVNTLIILSVTTSLALIVVIFYHEQLRIQFNISTAWLVTGVFIALAQLLTSLNLLLWRSEENAKSFASFQIVQMLIYNIAVLIFVVGFQMNWEGQLLGQSFAVILFAFISFYFMYRRGYLAFKIERIYILDALKVGIPLVPHYLSSWFKTGVDRIFLTTLVGTTAAGLYSIGYQFGMILGIATAAFNNAFSPYVYKKLSNITNQEKEKLVLLTYLYFVALILVSIIISFIAPWIITNFLDEKYSEAAKFVSWITFGYAFQAMYFMVAIYVFYVKKTHVLMLITFSSGLIHVLLSYFLIKFNGSIGAAQATTISFFITFILVWILSSKLYSMPWRLNLNTMYKERHIE